VISYDVLFRYFTKGTKVNHKILRSLYPISSQIYDFPSTSPK